MKSKIILAVCGFGFCIAASARVLPSGSELALINEENVFAYFGEFLFAFIKNPLAWIGIIMLFIAFREPVLSHNSSAYRYKRKHSIKPKIE